MEGAPDNHGPILTQSEIITLATILDRACKALGEIRGELLSFYESSIPAPPKRPPRRVSSSVVIGPQGQMFREVQGGKG